MVVPSIKPTTSAARIAANRENAKRSTGPRTEAGKAKSRLNGLKHGLRAQLPIIPGEDPEAFRRRLDEWILDLDPRTDVERYLIESAVLASWRLDRCRRAETAALTRKLLELETQAGLKEDQRVHTLGERLHRAPDYGLRQLRQTTRGCRWLLEQWRALDLALNTWPVFQGSHFHRALHLLGKELKDWHCDPVVARILTAYLASIFGNESKEEALEKTRRFLEGLRPELMGEVEFERRVRRMIQEMPAVIDGQVQLVEMVAEAVRELEGHLEQVKAREAKDRALALEEAMFEDSREGAARLRYEMAHQRVFRSALNDLRKAQEARAERGDEGQADWSDSIVPAALAEEVVLPAETNADDCGRSGSREVEVAPTEDNTGVFARFGLWREFVPSAETNAEIPGAVSPEVPPEPNAAPIGLVEVAAGSIALTEANDPRIRLAGLEQAPTPDEASREPNEVAGGSSQTEERDGGAETEREKGTEKSSQSRSLSSLSALSLDSLGNRLGPLFAPCILLILGLFWGGSDRPAYSQPEGRDAAIARGWAERRETHPPKSAAERDLEKITPTSWRQAPSSRLGGGPPAERPLDIAPPWHYYTIQWDGVGMVRRW